MPSKTKSALVALLFFGSASLVLADTHNLDRSLWLSRPTRGVGDHVRRSRPGP